MKLICKGSIIYDYTRKVLKLRKNIIKTNLKFKKIIMKNRYNKMLFKLQSFFPITEKMKNDINFPHGLSGIFISKDATIGKNCIIFQQVTIGSNTLLDSKGSGAPVIGDNVYIGAGAKIIGNVHIGNNVRIGANAIVVNDIQDNSTVVLQKPRIISHDKALNNKYVNIFEYDNSFVNKEIEH